MRKTIIIPVKTIYTMSTLSSKTLYLFHYGIHKKPNLVKKYTRTSITHILTYLNLVIKIYSFFIKNSLVFSNSRSSLLLELDF